MKKRKLLQSELEDNIWAVVTMTEVIVIDKTYDQCSMVIETQDLNPYEATICTSNAAREMLANGIKRNVDAGNNIKNQLAG